MQIKPSMILPPTVRSHISAASQIRQQTTSGRTEFFCPTGLVCGRPVGLELIALQSTYPAVGRDSPRKQLKTFLFATN